MGCKREEDVYLHESIFSLVSSEELSPRAEAGAFETMFWVCLVEYGV